MTNSKVIKFTEYVKKPIRTTTNKDKRPRGEYLSWKEVEQFIKGLRKVSRYPDRDECIVRVLYHHALRGSEALRLRWDQIEFGRTPRIHVKRLKGGIDSVHPIEQRRLLGLLLKLSKDDNRGEYVFMSERGTPLAYSSLDTIIKKANQVSGLGFPVHCHIFRHACGYHLVNKGMDMRKIQLFMGHKSIQNTVRYTKLDAGQFKGFWD